MGPICLPDPAHYYDSVTAVVTGWGRMESNGTLTEVLREDPVRTMTSQRGGGGAVAVMGQDGRYSGLLHQPHTSLGLGQDHDLAKR